MSLEYTGISYFPLNANFFEEEVTELLEAKFGIKASYIVMRLLCKIYKEGYFISWGKEQCIIFLRKSGGEVEENTMNQIITLLMDKNFFDKRSYEKYNILTSANIQKVWIDATSRRKRNLNKLPYLLTAVTQKNKPETCKQEENTNKENVDNRPIPSELNLEYEGNFEQRKEEQSKAYKEEEEHTNISLDIPPYAYNKTTHNVSGLIESLENHKVIDTKEQQTILRLSDYGRKGTSIWKLFPNTNWSKIGAPGKYIIAALTKRT